MFVSDIRSFWVIAGTLRVNLTRPVVSRAGRLFCVDERVCVCVFVRARVVGQRNYQKHAAGFFQSNINQTAKEKAPRSVSGLTDKCGRSPANVWDANMHYPPLPLSFNITQFVWDLHIWFMKAVCARERG